jgi:hypothetical protein
MAFQSIPIVKMDLRYSRTLVMLIAGLGVFCKRDIALPSL